MAHRTHANKTSSRGLALLEVLLISRSWEALRFFGLEPVDFIFGPLHVLRTGALRNSVAALLG